MCRPGEQLLEFTKFSCETDNGLNPEKDSIFLESVEEGSDNPYVNIIVARTADKDNELYKKVVDYFRTPEVAKVIEETYKGAYIPTWE